MPQLVCSRGFTVEAKGVGAGTVLLAICCCPAAGRSRRIEIDRSEHKNLISAAGDLLRGAD